MYFVFKTHIGGYIRGRSGYSVDVHVSIKIKFSASAKKPLRDVNVDVSLMCSKTFKIHMLPFGI